MMRDGYLERSKLGLRLSPKGLARQWEIHGTHNAWEDLTDSGQKTYALTLMRAIRAEWLLPVPMGTMELLARIRGRMRSTDLRRTMKTQDLRGISPKSSAHTKGSREINQYTNLLSIYLGIIKGIEEERFTNGP